MHDVSPSLTSLSNSLTLDSRNLGQSFSSPPLVDLDRTQICQYLSPLKLTRFPNTSFSF